MSRLNVLFLCTHNSARSILAEALLNHMGGERFAGYSAGSSPRENQQPHPLGLEVLQNAGIATGGLHSKSWDVFAGPDAPTWTSSLPSVTTRRAKSARSGRAIRLPHIGLIRTRPPAMALKPRNTRPFARRCTRCIAAWNC